MEAFDGVVSLLNNSFICFAGGMGMGNGHKVIREFLPLRLSEIRYTQNKYQYTVFYLFVSPILWCRTSSVLVEELSHQYPTEKSGKSFHHLY